MKRNTRRLTAMALAGVAVAASGCSVANSGGGGYDLNTLRIVLPQEPPTLEPCESSLTSTGVVVRSNITEPLVERNPTTGDLEPLLATVVCAELPDIATMQRSVKAREGRVYVDTVQNGSGKQLVCAWSARESERGTVSTPLSWSEVETDLDPRDFTMQQVAQRAHTLGDPLWEVMSQTVDLGRALTLLAERTG